MKGSVRSYIVAVVVVVDVIVTVFAGDNSGAIQIDLHTYVYIRIHILFGTNEHHYILRWLSMFTRKSMSLK